MAERKVSQSETIATRVERLEKVKGGGMNVSIRGGGAKTKFALREGVGMLTNTCATLKHSKCVGFARSAGKPASVRPPE